MKSSITKYEEEVADADFFRPQPPAGYASLKASASQILLPLTISNKCGQAFRWRGNQVWEATSDSDTKWKQDTEWSLCLADRVVLLRQDEQRGFLYHRTLCSQNMQGSIATVEEANAETSRWLIDYLNLDVPLEALFREWTERDKVFARFADRFSGLRMLRQDPWECLCAFICSSNNNIARIGQMVQNLCTHFSPALVSHTYPPSPFPPLAVEGQDEKSSEVEQLSSDSDPITITYHPFPSPEALAQEGVEEKLRQLGFGYRAKYLARTAQMLCEKHFRAHTAPDERTWLYGVRSQGTIKPDLLDVVAPSSPALDAANQPDLSRKRARAFNSDVKTEDIVEVSPHSVRSYLQSLRSMSYHDARSELIAFPGVGPKVADCVLLMSLDQHSSIPVDRHVFQFAEKWYHIRSGKYEDIAQRFRDLWGEYAGWAHSVLFTADLRSFATYKADSAQDAAKPKKEDPEFDSMASSSLPTPPASQQARTDLPGPIMVKTEPMAIGDLQHNPPPPLLTNTRPKRKSLA